jgi:hypothetical protein
MRSALGSGSRPDLHAPREAYDETGFIGKEPALES